MTVQPVSPLWTVRVLTLFPGMFPGPLGESLAGKALENRLWALETVDIRDFARDKHRSVDDAPFGGGAGMVMRPDVLDAALRAAAGYSEGIDGEGVKHEGVDREGVDREGVGRAIYLTPRGRVLDQALVRELAAAERVTVLCGRYEGVDQRVIEARGLEEVSVGDFVLSGGEPAAMVLIDACVRLLPGVMGNQETAGEESFEGGLLEYPHYTRPAVWTDGEGVARSVPEVLLSGHHDRIRTWRHAEAERLTRERRPDLWALYAAARADEEARLKKPRKQKPRISGIQEPVRESIRVTSPETTQETTQQVTQQTKSFEE